MKNNGDIDDQVYDWNLLNGIPPCLVHFRRRVLNGSLTGGGGWESAVTQNGQTLQQVQNTQPARRPDGPAQSTPVPPSPALVRHGSKKGQPPGNLLIPNNSQPGPGHLTPLSGVAQINVSITPNRPPGHQNSYEFRDESYIANQTYERASPMVSTIQNPPPLSANRPGGLQNGISEQVENESPKFSLWRILTCRCL